MQLQEEGRRRDGEAYAGRCKSRPDAASEAGRGRDCGPAVTPQGARNRATCHKARPFHSPDGRVQGARPANAATSRRPRLPSSGSLAMRVRAMVRPTPWTEVSTASRSRQAGKVRTASLIAPSISACSRCSTESRRSMLRRSLGPQAGQALPLGHHHGDHRAPAGEQVGVQLGFGIVPAARFIGRAEAPNGARRQCSEAKQSGGLRPASEGGPERVNDQGGGYETRADQPQGAPDAPPPPHRLA